MLQSYSHGVASDETEEAAAASKLYLLYFCNHVLTLVDKFCLL